MCMRPMIVDFMQAVGSFRRHHRRLCRRQRCYGSRMGALATVPCETFRNAPREGVHTLVATLLSHYHVEHGLDRDTGRREGVQTMSTGPASTSVPCAKTTEKTPAGGTVEL